jgi:hypothetical protein
MIYCYYSLKPVFPGLHCTEGSKSISPGYVYIQRGPKVTSPRAAGARNVYMMTLGMTICARFTPDGRHIRESDARSVQQGMLLLDPSIQPINSHGWVRTEIYLTPISIHRDQCRNNHRIKYWDQPAKIGDADIFQILTDQFFISFEARTWSWV